MTVSSSAFAEFQRDPSLPFWQNYVDADSIFDKFSDQPDRAQAWLRHRKVSETCTGFVQATTMHGHFEGGVLSDHTFQWSFTPGRKGDLAITVPVRNGGRLVDFAAMSRHDHDLWGTCTGHGQYLGELGSSRLRIHRSLAGWLANDCDGILPLSKLFFPQLRNAPTLVAEDDSHAWELAYRVFIDPAAKFGCDEAEAEEQAYAQIEVA
jgi:hypothetical protein